MKKLILITGMLTGMTFLTVNAFTQSAQTADKTSKTQSEQTTTTTPGKFVDSNGDGICDHHQNKGKNSQCANFTDKNGDGTCDNYQADKNCCKTNCCGKGSQGKNCQGMGQGNCFRGGGGKGDQHRHGRKNCQQTAQPQPETK
ncbi:MAG: hypothetical protein V1733_01445 [bacterium]